MYSRCRFRSGLTRARSRCLDLPSPIKSKPSNRSTLSLTVLTLVQVGITCCAQVVTSIRECEMKSPTEFNGIMECEELRRVGVLEGLLSCETYFVHTMWGVVVHW